MKKKKHIAILIIIGLGLFLVAVDYRLRTQTIKSIVQAIQIQDADRFLQAGKDSASGAGKQEAP